MIIDVELIRAIAAAMGVAGSILLAWRVTGILNVLGKVATEHERQIHELADHVVGPRVGVLPMGIPVFPARKLQKARALGLLVAGFALSVTSGVLNLLAGFLS